jgi:hypothetical protein
LRKLFRHRKNLRNHSGSFPIKGCAVIKSGGEEVSFTMPCPPVCPY